MDPLTEYAQLIAAPEINSARVVELARSMGRNTSQVLADLENARAIRRDQATKAAAAEAETRREQERRLESLTPGQASFARGLKLPDQQPAAAVADPLANANLSPGQQSFARGLKLPT